MTQHLHPTGKHTAADIPAVWLHQVRGMLLHYGHAVRPHAGRNAIELREPGDETWYFLNLPPAIAVDFASAEDRDAIYDVLTGRVPLPEIPLSKSNEPTTGS